MPFLELLGEAAARKKGMHFGVKVWIFMPFLGVLGETAARKKGMHLEQKCGFLCLFGLLGGGCSIEKGRAF